MSFTLEVNSAEVLARFHEVLAAGESKTVEVKTSFRDPSALARLIASFANTEGGTIVVGVREPASVIGLDEPRFRKEFDAACQLLQPIPRDLAINFLSLEDDAKVAIITVGKSSNIVLAQGGAYVRVDTTTRPMSWQNTMARAQGAEGAVTLETIAKAIQKQSEAYDKANSPKAKRTERLLGFGLGILASLVAAALWLCLTKVIPAFL